MPVKHSTVDLKSKVRIPPVALPLLPLGVTSLSLKEFVGKIKLLLPDVEIDALHGLGWIVPQATLKT